jgi:asparagine synthase (glutamine-hydrolysing)
MFALAIYNKEQSELILARDHAGIKPLYYTIEDGKLYFASEIRALKTLNKFAEHPNWRIYFLAFGHLPEPITTLKGVTQLPKGTYLKINLSSLLPNKLNPLSPSQNLKLSKSETLVSGFWSLDSLKLTCFSKFNFTNEITNVEEAKSLVRKTLIESVKRHLISDAPIGLFLSGGIDSSLLTILSEPTLKDKLQTLSIVFKEERFSERQYQEIIIKQTGAKHQTFVVSEQDFKDSLPEAFEAMDQPSTDGINTFFICKYAKQAGLTAVLSGLGADELFGGYNSFENASKIATIQKWIPSSILNLTQFLWKDKYKKISYLSFGNAVGDYLFNRGFLNTKEIAYLLNESEAKVKNLLMSLGESNNSSLVSGLWPLVSNYTNLSPFNKASHLEQNYYMQNQLLKDSDYMSMWHSIEIRVPFLDKELMELAHKISPEVKAHNGQKKFLLIDSFKELPRAIWDRPKQGFTFPFSVWMKGFRIPESRDQKPETRKDIYVKEQFEKGNYSWSRYWAYQLTKIV